MATWTEKLSVIRQYLVPQHCLSRLIGRLADCRWRWLKNSFIKWFIQRYQVNMQEAAEPNPEIYPNFNSFFVRALRANARPLATDERSIICPVDGSISQIGAIQTQTLIQAKGHHYSLPALLGGNSDKAALFQHGQFATLYLAPRDYHRVHMPLDGQLIEMWHVPGRLFSVNTLTTQHIPQLFARNERVACFFNTEAGPLAVILVGAMIVASIETVWAGTITPPARRTVRQWNYQTESIHLACGAELGRFKLGSTVIVLFSAGRVKWLESFTAGVSTKMGQQLGVKL